LSLFCVITLSIPSKDIASLPEHWWSFLIQLLRTQLGKDKLPNEPFRVACGGNTTKDTVFYRLKGVAERFDAEIEEERGTAILSPSSNEHNVNSSSGNNAQPELAPAETHQAGEGDASQLLKTTGCC
jgi:hypothetical protein